MSNQPDRKKHVDRYPRFAINILIALLVGAVVTSCAPTTPIPAPTAIVHTVEATATLEPTHVPETVAPTATPTAVPIETPPPTPTEEVSEEPQPVEGEYQLFPITRNLSIRVYVDQANPEFSDSAELEQFIEHKEFVLELLEMRKEVYLMVTDYLGVSYGEQDLQKMHLDFSWDGSVFQLALIDSRNEEGTVVRKITISADNNFIYVDRGNGPEQMAQHLKVYTVNYAGAEFTIRHVVSWPEQIATLNPALVIEYYMRCLMHNPDLRGHLGLDHPFESPEEVVAFYLQQREAGNPLMVPTTTNPGEPGKHNKVVLEEGNPFNITIVSLIAVSNDTLRAYNPYASTYTQAIRTGMRVNPNTQGITSFHVIEGDHDHYAAIEYNRGGDRDTTDARLVVVPSEISYTPIGTSRSTAPQMETVAPDLAAIFVNPALANREPPQ